MFHKNNFQNSNQKEDSEHNTFSNSKSNNTGNFQNQNNNQNNLDNSSLNLNQNTNPSKFRSGNFRSPKPPKVPLISEKKQIPSRILNEKQFLFSKVASFLLIIAILIFGSSFYLWQNQNSQNNANLVQNSASSSPLSFSNSDLNSISQNSNTDSNSNSSSISSSVSSSSVSSAKTFLVDNKGAKISEFIKKNSGIDMGLLSNSTFEELGIKPPIDVSKIEQGLWQENPPNISNSVSNSQNLPQNTQNGQIITNAQDNSQNNSQNRPPKTLEEIIPKPQELEDKNVEPITILDKKNLLVFPKYKIEVPIIHLSFDQMYPRNKNGEIDFNSELNFPIDRPVCQQAVYRDTCHPVQKALELGAVHLPMSVHPGEIGTSYIAAHTSNWSFVKSPYNSIFKPMEGQTKVGDEFFVFDNWGRKLKFRIFDSLEIRADDLVNAYKKFDNRRTITLQGSVLKWTKQGLQPTHRWLSRGELVEEPINLNSSSSANS